MTDAATRSTRWRLLAATSIGSALAFLDVTVVNVALPAIGQDLALGLSGQQWAVLAYALTLSACYLAAGAVADRIGLQRAFRIGTAAFMFASIGVGFASNEAMLLLGRGVQGVAAALLTTSSLALLRAAWAEDAGRAIGLWTSFTSAAILIGPPVGGAVVELASWRWIFLANVPLAIVAIVLALDRGRPLAAPERTRAPDAWSLLLATLAIGGVTALLVERSQLGISLALGVAVISAVAFVGVVVRQRGGATALVPGELMRRRSFVAAIVATVLLYGALGASAFYVALYLQSPVVGYSPLEAGLVQVPTTIVLLAFAPTFGRIADRRGPRGLLIAGGITYAIALLLLSTVDDRSLAITGAAPFVDVHHVDALVPANLLAGLALAFFVAPITTTTLRAAPERFGGIASAASNLAARIGSLLSIAVIGAAVVSRDAFGTQRAGAQLVSDERAFQLVMVACAVLAVLAATTIAAWLRDDPAAATTDTIEP